MRIFVILEKRGKRLSDDITDSSYTACAVIIHPIKIFTRLGRKEASII